MWLVVSAACALMARLRVATCAASAPRQEPRYARLRSRTPACGRARRVTFVTKQKSPKIGLEPMVPRPPFRGCQKSCAVFRLAPGVGTWGFVLLPLLPEGICSYTRPLRFARAYCGDRRRSSLPCVRGGGCPQGRRRGCEEQSPTASRSPLYTRGPLEKTGRQKHCISRRSSP